MRSLLSVFAVAALTGAVPAAPAAAVPALATSDVELTASTVLTLEGGLVGTIPGLRITRSQLQGSLCASGNVCRGVDYPAWPGDNFNEDGGKLLRQAVNGLATGTGPVVLFGHSQGGQVIDAALRYWKAHPGEAPDPSRVSWVSIGNPDNAYGGVRAKLGTFNRNTADTDYQGIEVIRQYDGWADFPDDRTNILAVLNAVVGSQTVHPFYFNVDINDPANVRYTPDKSDGSPGNITYVLVPTKTLPLIANTGILAPVLDSWLRPIVEAGYNRPGGAPVSAASVRPARVVPAVKTVAQPAATSEAGDSGGSVRDQPSRGEATEQRDGPATAARPSRAGRS